MSVKMVRQIGAETHQSEPVCGYGSLSAFESVGGDDQAQQEVVTPAGQAPEVAL
jgi:hypothetical protein